MRVAVFWQWPGVAAISKSLSSLLSDVLPVSTLKEQLEDMRKINQNSQASNDKIVQLQNQVPAAAQSGHTQTRGDVMTVPKHLSRPVVTWQ